MASDGHCTLVSPGTHPEHGPASARCLVGPLLVALGLAAGCGRTVPILPDDGRVDGTDEYDPTDDWPDEPPPDPPDDWPDEPPPDPPDDGPDEPPDEPPDPGSCLGTVHLDLDIEWGFELPPCDGEVCSTDLEASCTVLEVATPGEVGIIALECVYDGTTEAVATTLLVSSNPGPRFSLTEGDAIGLIMRRWSAFEVGGAWHVSLFDGEGLVFYYSWSDQYQAEGTSDFELAQDTFNVDLRTTDSACDDDPAMRAIEIDVQGDRLEVDEGSWGVAGGYRLMVAGARSVPDAFAWEHHAVAVFEIWGG